MGDQSAMAGVLPADIRERPDGYRRGVPPVRRDGAAHGLRRSVCGSRAGDVLEQAGPPAGVGQGRSQIDPPRAGRDLTPPPAETAPFRVGGAGCCEAPTCKRFTIRRFCCDRRRTTHQRDIRVAHARRGRSRITRARVAPCGGPASQSASGRRVYRDEAERGNNRIVMSAAVPTCAAVGRCTVGPMRPSVGWSEPQDMGVSVAEQMAGLLASIRTLPLLLTQPNGSAATVPAQSTRLASRRFWANVGPPLFARVCSHPDWRQCRPRAAPPTAVTVQLSRLPTA